MDTLPQVPIAVTMANAITHAAGGFSFVAFVSSSLKCIECRSIKAFASRWVPKEKVREVGLVQANNPLSKATFSRLYSICFCLLACAPTSAYRGALLTALV